MNISKSKIIIISCIIIFLIWWFKFRNMSKYFTIPMFNLTEKPIEFNENYQSITESRKREATGLGKDIDVYMSVIDEPEYIANYHSIKTGNNLICLEHIVDDRNSAVPRLIFIPNQELVSVKDEKYLLNSDKVHHVLCKSQYSRAIFEKIKTDYNCKWNVESFIFPPVFRTRFFSYPKDRNIYFHPAGGSWMKHTSRVLEAWSRNPDWPLLIVTCQGLCRTWHIEELRRANLAVNIQIYGLLNQKDMYILQKHAGVIILPSACEGFGHSQYEAMENGNLLISADIPPLNENLIDGNNCLLIPTTSSEALGDPSGKFKWLHNLSKYTGQSGSFCFDISVRDIEEAIERSLILSSNEYYDIRFNAVQKVHDLAKIGYESIRSTFNKVGIHTREREIEVPLQYRVFDCFMGSTGEENLLLLRIATTFPYVHKYIIIDSQESHTGLRKPLLDLSQIPEHFRYKIVYENVIFPKSMQVQDTNNASDTSIAWDREGYQRDRIMFHLNRLANPTDFCYISDLDEIPYYDRILKNNMDIDKLVHYELPTYVFNINFREKDYIPHCAIGASFKYLSKALLMKDTSLTSLRFEGLRQINGEIKFLKHLKAKNIERYCTVHLNRFSSPIALVRKEVNMVESRGQSNEENQLRRYFRIVCNYDNGKPIEGTHIRKVLSTSPDVPPLVFKYLHPIHTMSPEQLKKLYASINHLSDMELTSFVKTWFR